MLSVITLPVFHTIIFLVLSLTSLATATSRFERYSFDLNMAETEAAVQSDHHVLEWTQKDKHRLLHVVYRVGDLERTIKFYTECLGMQVLRSRDITDEKYSNAFLGFGHEESHFVVELTYNMLLPCLGHFHNSICSFISMLLNWSF